jgi:hypothetical protein
LIEIVYTFLFALIYLFIFTENINYNNMKNTTISFRVNEDVADRLENVCDKIGVSRSKFLSDLIDRNFSDKKNISLDKNLSNLERILFKLKTIVDSDYNEYIKQNTPCIIKGNKDDMEYEGLDLILVGDDTEIREKDGKFYIYELDDDESEPIWLSEGEVLDFYKGQYESFGTVPSLIDSSYQYVKGYLSVMRTLLPTLEEEFEEYSNLNKKK